MKLTQWFPGTVKPVRPGVYQRNLWGKGALPAYSYWNGERWCLCRPTAHEAVEERHPSDVQDAPWRGVAK